MIDFRAFTDELAKLASRIPAPRPVTRQDVQRFGLSVINEPLDPDKGVHRIIEHEGTLHGFASYSPESKKLERIWVAPEHRRQGVATRLLASLPAIETLNVRRTNDAAQALYRKHGLEVTGPANGSTSPRSRRVVMQKLADIIYGSSEDHPITAGGLFVSAPRGQEARVSADVRKLFAKHQGIQATKAALQKKYPQAFVTAAFKREAPPSGLKKFFGMGGYHAKSFEERQKNPRLFFRVGQAGGYDQQAFYKEVSRGLYDRELQHLPKKERIVYV